MLKKLIGECQQAGCRHTIAGSLRKAADRIGGDAPGHQLAAHHVLSRYMSFEDKDILEVGGGQSCDSARPFLESGASRVVVTGLDHIETEQADSSKRLNILRADALELSKVFAPCSFDAIYGLSVIEHIPSPKLFMKEVFTALKPGGVAYFEGNPIWSSPKGHHLWVATWGGGYQNKATANYLFSEWPNVKSANPLPDWSHLLMSQGEMGDYLSGKRIPDEDVDCIIDWVFHCDDINRLTMTEIAEAYTTSRLTVLDANTWRANLPHDTLMALNRAKGDRIDYGIAGVSYVLGKPR